MNEMPAASREGRGGNAAPRADANESLREAEAVLAFDRSHLVHPNGHLSPAAPEPLLLVSGRGVRVQDVRGEEYLDAISGLMNVNAGYGRADLSAAATLASELGYATLFFGQGNVFAARLAKKLAEITPGELDRFFFTLGGSDANDTVFRLVRMQNVAAGRPAKLKILARLGGYHGATLATLSAGGEPSRHERIGLRMPGFVDLEQPRPGFDAVGELRSVIEREGAETIAALIAEPIAYQAGMIVPPDDYWPRVRELCTRHDIVLAIDEVLTGFGRTGKMFAIEHWDVVPDVLVMSKGLTSGYLPLAAVGLSAAYYRRVVASLGSGEGLLGFTGTGHPACCAVALANIEAIEREDLVERAAAMGQHLSHRLEELRTRSNHVTGWRVLGLLAGVDVARGDDADASFCAKVVATLRREHKVLTRAFGPTIAIAPPLVASNEDIDAICEAIEIALARAA